MKNNNKEVLKVAKKYIKKEILAELNEAQIVALTMKVSKILQK